MELKIIFENSDFLVIDKPAGLLVHPTKNRLSQLADGEESPILVDWLLKKYPEIKNVGEDSIRPGIVHRLDKDTSGLIIIAKNNQAFYFLKKQFQERQIKKKYLALVYGKLKDQKGTITKSISRSKKDSKKRTALLDENAKPAWTEYKVIKTYKLPKENYFSLLEVAIKTGRTHQIRVHLTSIGHPIVGDQQYKFKRQNPPENLKRQFLHAQYLKFQLLNGKMIELKSELPDDLKSTLLSLREVNEVNDEVIPR